MVYRTRHRVSGLPGGGEGQSWQDGALGLVLVALQNFQLGNCLPLLWQRGMAAAGVRLYRRLDDERKPGRLEVCFVLREWLEGICGVDAVMVSSSVNGVLVNAIKRMQYRMRFPVAVSCRYNGLGQDFNSIRLLALLVDLSAIQS